MKEQQIVDKPKIYQALGVVSGILELSEGHYSSLLIEAQSYLVTVSPKVQAKHQAGQLQNFKVYPAIIEGKLGFSLRLTTQTSAKESGIILKGCWEIHEEEPRLVIHRNRTSRDKARITVLPLIWKEAPVADGQYWEIEAKLEGDKFEVMQAIGPLEPPQKYQKQVEKDFANAKSDLPPPILKGERRPIEPPESQMIAGTASTPITINANRVIEETPIASKAVEVIEPMVASESKDITEVPSESITPEKLEASSVVAEAATPKAKKASSKSLASKKSSFASETSEPKKTKEKVKSNRSKKPMSLVAADRLFLGKYAPGK